MFALNIQQNILLRYGNIIPYDATRIPLLQPIDGSDYINASWITKGARLSQDVPNMCSGISFIASQGPNLKTSPHYLQMIFENKVDIIVMLTKVIEESAKGI